MFIYLQINFISTPITIKLITDKFFQQLNGFKKNDSAKGQTPLSLLKTYLI